jgi:hypothetical protein
VLDAKKKGIVQPVITPEHLTLDEEYWRAKNSYDARVSRLLPQVGLRRLSLSLA